MTQDDDMDVGMDVGMDLGMDLEEEEVAGASISFLLGTVSLSPTIIGTVTMNNQSTA